MQITKRLWRSPIFISDKYLETIYIWHEQFVLREPWIGQTPSKLILTVPYHNLENCHFPIKLGNICIYTKSWPLGRFAQWGYHTYYSWEKVYIPAFISCLIEMTEPLPFIASAFLSVLNLYQFYILMEIV